MDKHFSDRNVLSQEQAKGTARSTRDPEEKRFKPQTELEAERALKRIELLLKKDK